MKKSITTYLILLMQIIPGKEYEKIKEIELELECNSDFFCLNKGFGKWDLVIFLSNPSDNINELICKDYIIRYFKLPIIPIDCQPLNKSYNFLSISSMSLFVKDYHSFKKEKNRIVDYIQILNSNYSGVTHSFFYSLDHSDFIIVSKSEKMSSLSQFSNDICEEFEDLCIKISTLPSINIDLLQPNNDKNTQVLSEEFIPIIFIVLQYNTTPKILKKIEELIDPSYNLIPTFGFHDLVITSSNKITIKDYLDSIKALRSQKYIKSTKTVIVLNCNGYQKC